ncbi:MAG: hypothetical protein GY710_12135 [Desulfobacteraceae bacterium]|nr:hypothetical protein [Desulfobacteraceae bacterium]
MLVGIKKKDTKQSCQNAFFKSFRAFKSNTKGCMKNQNHDAKQPYEGR